MQQYVILVPAIFAGILSWVFVFLQTYGHFPKMDREEKIAMSIASSTIIAFLMGLLIYLAMLYIEKYVIMGG